MVHDCCKNTVFNSPIIYRKYIIFYFIEINDVICLKKTNNCCVNLYDFLNNCKYEMKYSYVNYSVPKI